MKSLNLIVAKGSDGSIGKDGDLLWHLSADLKHFKAVTMGHAVVMGRRTWESLPKGALPGRTNIVVSRNPQFQAPGAQVYPSLEEALEAAYRVDPEPFIIGGGTLYAATLPMATRLYLTEVEATYPQADTRFPALDPAMWRTEEEEPRATDPKSGLTYRFLTLSRPQ